MLSNAQIRVLRGFCLQVYTSLLLTLKRSKRQIRACENSMQYDRRRSANIGDYELFMNQGEIFASYLHEIARKNFSLSSAEKPYPGGYQICCNWGQGFFEKKFLFLILKNS